MKNLWKQQTEESFQQEKMSLALSLSSWFVQCREMDRKEMSCKPGKILTLFNPED